MLMGVIRSGLEAGLSATRIYDDIRGTSLSVSTQRFYDMARALRAADGDVGMFAGVGNREIPRELIRPERVEPSRRPTGKFLADMRWLRGRDADGEPTYGYASLSFDQRMTAGEIKEAIVEKLDAPGRVGAYTVRGIEIIQIFAAEGEVW